MESWLIWQLTGGKAHVTDVSNASRTMLLDTENLCWDKEILRALDIPEQMLPRLVSNSENYGVVAHHPGFSDLTGIPICAAVGDQQAALFGQGCLRPGMAKNTYGTGCFTLMNLGGDRVTSHSGLVTTIGWKLGEKVSYVLEGSVFNAGSAIQWLRDGAGVVTTAHETDILAERAEDNQGVYFVPAFTGLGAPYWDPDARGCFFGLTRGTDKAVLCRSVLEAIAYEVADLVRTMNQRQQFHDAVPGGPAEYPRGPTPECGDHGLRRGGPGGPGGGGLCRAGGAGKAAPFGAGLYPRHAFGKTQRPLPPLAAGRGAEPRLGKRRIIPKGGTRYEIHVRRGSQAAAQAQ